MKLECPHCEKEHDNLKTVTLLECRFYLLVYQTRTETLIGCPDCLRKMILKRLFAPQTILLDNLMYPLTLITHLVAYFQPELNRPGHSRKVLQILQEAYEDLSK